MKKLISLLLLPLSLFAQTNKFVAVGWNTNNAPVGSVPFVSSITSNGWTAGAPGESYFLSASNAVTPYPHFQPIYGSNIVGGVASAGSSNVFLVISNLTVTNTWIGANITDSNWTTVAAVTANGNPYDIKWDAHFQIKWDGTIDANVRLRTWFTYTDVYGVSTTNYMYDILPNSDRYLSYNIEDSYPSGGNSRTDVAVNTDYGWTAGSAFFMPKSNTSITITAQRIGSYSGLTSGGATNVANYYFTSIGAGSGSSSGGSSGSASNVYFLDSPTIAWSQVGGSNYAQFTTTATNTWQNYTLSASNSITAGMTNFVNGRITTTSNGLYALIGSGSGIDPRFTSSSGNITVSSNSLTASNFTVKSTIKLDTNSYITATFIDGSQKVIVQPVIHNPGDAGTYWGDAGFTFDFEAHYLKGIGEGATNSRWSLVFGEIDPHSWNIGPTNLLAGTTGPDLKSVIEIDSVNEKEIFGAPTARGTKIRGTNVVISVGAGTITFGTNNVTSNIPFPANNVAAGAVQYNGSGLLVADTSFVYGGAGDLHLGTTGTGGTLKLYDADFDREATFGVNNGNLWLLDGIYTGNGAGLSNAIGLAASGSVTITTNANGRLWTIGGSGGDVLAAGNNNFTGSNNFAGNVTFVLGPVGNGLNLTNLSVTNLRTNSGSSGQIPTIQPNGSVAWSNAPSGSGIATSSGTGTNTTIKGLVMSTLSGSATVNVDNYSGTDFHFGNLSFSNISSGVYMIAPFASAFLQYRFGDTSNVLASAGSGINGIGLTNGVLTGNGSGLSNAVDLIASTGITLVTNAGKRSFTISSSGGSGSFSNNNVNAWVIYTNNLSSVSINSSGTLFGTNYGVANSGWALFTNGNFVSTGTFNVGTLNATNFSVLSAWDAALATNAVDLIPGSNITITTNANKRSFTITASAGAGSGTYNYAELTNLPAPILLVGTNQGSSLSNTVDLIAGSNITITTNAFKRSFTIASTGGGGGSGTLTNASTLNWTNLGTIVASDFIATNSMTISNLNVNALNVTNEYIWVNSNQWSTNVQQKSRMKAWLRFNYVTNGIPSGSPATYFTITNAINVFSNGGFTFDLPQGSITNQNAGWFNISFNTAVRGNNNTITEIGLHTNGVECTLVEGTTFIPATSTTNWSTCAGSGWVYLPANTYSQLKISSFSSAVTNVTRFTSFMIDGL